MLLFGFMLNFLCDCSSVTAPYSIVAQTGVHPKIT